MNSNLIKNYCKKNNIEIKYHNEYGEYMVIQGERLLYVGSTYQRCLDYIVEVIINDKYTNNR